MSRLLLLFVHLLTCCSYGFVSGAQCPNNQSLLLLKVKQGVTFPNGPRLGSWVAGSDCCLWEGVTCDNASGLIIGLDLSPPDYDQYNSMEGPLDPSLFQLGSLRTLDLSYNTFDESTISFGLLKLTNLTHLALSGCGLSSGQIPLAISHLTRLVFLDLSDNYYLKLDLKIFLRNLTALQELYLDSMMSIDGREWSQAISSSLPRLRVLSLHNCWLPGPIHATLLQLPFLSELHLGYNNLSSVTIDSSNSSSIGLRFLDLKGCGLELGHDRLLEKIFRLPNLQTLDLSENIFPSGSLLSFPPYLQFLRLSNSKLFGTLPKNIFSLKFLNHLDLSLNHLTGRIPEKLGDLKFLNHLDLSLNHLIGGIPEKLSDLKFLNHLDLSLNHLTGDIPEKLGDLKFLNHLDLSSNNLTGVIVKKMGHLNFLNFLDLSDNQLTGCIPLSFKLLRNLTYISLSINMLNGTIPSFLPNLPSLQQLNLSQNLFHGPLPEFTNPSSSSLSFLDLRNNKLNGSIPGSMLDLSQLEVLALASNNFSGTIDFWLFHNGRNIFILNLSDNSVTVEFKNGSIDNSPLFSLSHLTILMLRSCNMSEFPWLILHNQTFLIHLDLSNNGIHGGIPNWIWQFEFLEYLNLSHNLLTAIEQPITLLGSPLDTLDLHANMLEGSLPIPPSASFLDYSRNRFASTIPTNIGRYLSSANLLSLSSNRFKGEIPPTICKSDALKVLDMSDNYLNGSIPWCITNMTRLSIINLRGNNLRGKIPDGFVEASSLKTLNLNFNRLSGPVPKSLLNCTKLEVLDLGNNHLDGTFPFWLEKLPHLCVLVLRSNRFHGPIKPSETRQGFQRLQIIDISSNRFIGNLPTKYFQGWKFMIEGGETDHEGPEDNFLRFEVDPRIGIGWLHYESKLYYHDEVILTSKGHELSFTKILTIFMSVDLSNNRFQGHIPEELGNLKFLVVLNLSHNNLEGQIPISLGNLCSVESMDLSRNSLSGVIPTQLTKLNFLEVLDVSHNRLTGRIPEGAQFSTFTNASFEGNLGLCGPPLSSNCTRTTVVEPIKGEATDDEGEQLEFIVAGIAGFFCGITLVIWPLVFWRNWRRWYYNQVDKVLLWLSK